MKINPPTNLQLRKAERRAWIARQRAARSATLPASTHDDADSDDPPYGARNRRGELLDCFDAYREWRGE